MNSAPDVERLEKVARAALVGSPQGWTAHPADGDYDYFVDAGGAYLGACPDCGVRSSFDKEDATHIAAFDPPTALALVAEVRELRAKVEKVREVHRRFSIYEACPEDGCENAHCFETAEGDYVHDDDLVGHVCHECSDLSDEEPIYWPCDTIKALGEEA